MESSVTRNKILLFVFAEAILLSGFVLTMAWLWDRWLIPGPHGPIRWVGMDFVPYWVGVRDMLSGQSPYGPGTTQAIQSTLLGGPPEIGGDPMLFVYPAWIFLLLVPWALAAVALGCRTVDRTAPVRCIAPDWFSCNPLGRKPTACHGFLGACI